MPHLGFLLTPMVETLQLQCEYTAVFRSVALFLGTVMVSAGFFAWLRGAPLIPEQWIPTSPMFIKSRRAAFLGAVALSCAGFVMFLLAPYRGHIRSITFFNDSSGTRFQLRVLALWSSEVSPKGGVKQVSYVYNFWDRDFPEDYRYRLTFKDGKTYRTLPITVSSARELQRVLQRHATDAEWLSKPVL
ncbi:MAG: hypothetical protein IT363_02250 [Methanoregulaceae archaeon]|nr:hypothetical protein [Methanoregulaceae archaeon]